MWMSSTLKLCFDFVAGLIPETNRLVLVLKSGEQIEMAWQSPSRRDSWTPEMRQAARVRQRNIIEEKGTQ